MVLRCGQHVGKAMKKKNPIPSVSGVPSLSTNEVASVAPSHRVLAAFTHGVHRRTTTIGPPGVEVAIMGPHTVSSVLAPFKGCGGIAVVALREEVEGSSQNASGSRHGKQDRLERDHDEVECFGSCLRCSYTTSEGT
jgi:hypothetical protein